jgi:hypothetical protein
MNVSDLERVEFTATVDESRSERAQLAQDAKAVLGYEKLARLVGPDSLLETLRKLDIAPLVTSGVERYKGSKEKKGMWVGHQVGVAAMVIFIALAMGSARMWFLFSVATALWTNMWTFALGVATAFVAIADAAPGACFFVSGEKLPKGDPFLMVAARGTNCYIVERWDEPNFRER